MFMTELGYLKKEFGLTMADIRELGHENLAQLKEWAKIEMAWIETEKKLKEAKV